MIKNFINSISIINFIKIVFVFTILVSGVGEVSAGAQDDACRDISPFARCQYGDLSTCDTSKDNKKCFCIPKKTGNNGIPGNLFCEDNNTNIEQAKECKWRLDSNIDCMVGNIPGKCSEKAGVGNLRSYECKISDPGASCDALSCQSPKTCKITNGQAACFDTDACDDACKTDPDKPLCQITGGSGEGECVASTDYKCTPNPCPTDKPHCIVKTGETTGTCSSANIPAPNPVDPNDPNNPNNPTPTIEYVEFKNPIRFNNLIELLAGITNALLTLLGVIAVLVVMASGFKYMTSSNPGEVSQAVGGIRNAIIGIVVIMGAYLIINYVISALL